MTDKIIFRILRSLIFLFGLLPFRVIYGLSDLAYLLVYYIAGYRKQLVYKNLSASFPEMTEDQIKSIAKKFYHHFCDVMLESMKSFSMSEEEVRKRYRFVNPELMDALYAQGKSAVCVAGHYNNWEWGGIAAGSQMKMKPVGFYKPLSNKHVDDFLQKTRVKGNSVLASIVRTAETFQKYKGESAAFYMISDQRPSSTRFAYWMKFLNQDTPVLHGPEKYARIYNYPVVFADIRKIRRGFYEVEFILIEPEPLTSENGSVTRRFMQLLESQIIKSPQYYLWTHNRWKFKKPEGS